MAKKNTNNSKEKQDEKIDSEIERLKKFSDDEITKEKYKLIARSKTERNYKNILSGFTILVTIVISVVTMMQGIDNNTTISTDEKLRYMYDKEFELYKLKHTDEEYIEHVSGIMDEYKKDSISNILSEVKSAIRNNIPLMVLYFLVGIVVTKLIKKANKASFYETLVIFINDELERRSKMNLNEELKKSIKDDIYKLQSKSIEIEKGIKYIESISKSIYK